MSDTLTQKEVAAHLDMTPRRVRDVLADLGVDYRTHSIDDIRVSYIRDLREKAAGRNDEDLGEARRLDTLASHHLKMLDIYDKHGKVIWTPQFEPLLAGLIESVQTSVMEAGAKIIAGLNSQGETQIDNELITSSLRAALRNVERSGGELVASVFGESETAGTGGTASDD